MLAAYHATLTPPVESLWIGHGPALRVFQRFGHQPVDVPSEELSTLDVFISGQRVAQAVVSTGATGYEADALGVLRRLGVATTAIVEHWVGYRERFGYPHEDWISNLPERVLFLDERAVGIALSVGFPADRIGLIENPCHAIMRERFLSRFGSSQRLGSFTVLLVAEDLSESAGRLLGEEYVLGFDEFDVVRGVAAAVALQDGARLILRPHPNEAPSKYGMLAEELGFIISEASDLLADVARCDVVVGCCTVALVNSLELARPAVSYVPTGHNGLPAGLGIEHPGLRRVADVDALNAVFAELAGERASQPRGRVAAIIEARTGSSRLPGKVLMDVGGQPALEAMVSRVRAALKVDEIVIATTDNPGDIEVAALCESLGIACFRGSENDVLGRVVGAARSVEADVIVELTGDCVLVDPEVIDRCVDAFFAAPSVDYVSNSTPYTWPEGFEVQVFPLAALKWVDDQIDDAAVREHVSLYFYEEPGRYVTRAVVWEDAARHRPEWHLSLDEPADLQVIRAVWDGLGGGDRLFSVTEVVDFLDSHPEIRALNRYVAVKGARDT